MKSESTGIEQIGSHVLSLTDRLVRGLQDKGYQVLSPREPGEGSGIVSFVSDLHDHEQIQQHLLAEHRVLIACREGRLRSSPHLYNSPEEIDQLVGLPPSH